MTSYVDDIAISNDKWFRMAQTLLSLADIKINGHRPFDIAVNNPQFFKRVLQQGSIGLGESYMDGWWQCPRLDIFFQRLLQAKINEQLPFNFSEIIQILVNRLWNRQSIKRAHIVGKEHYDLGNDLFKLILDPYMQYSCGYWKEADNLEQAQQNKLQLICEKLQLKSGMTLLDIGCGWGGLAAYAAKHYHVNVTGITISAEQQKLAQQRCQDLDVTILLQDYRYLNKKFDRVVSVGMFEHVGPKNYHTFFNVVTRNIKEDGIFLLHSIGSNKTDLNVDPWINKYIFPNGCLPSIKQIANASERYFVMEDWHNFGSDYDKTLIAWYQRFLAAWPQLADNYSERFKRMFSYYLNACAGAFRARDIQLWQIIFSPNGLTGGIQAPR